MFASRPVLILAALLALSGCAAESCRDRPCGADEKLAEAVKTELDRHAALLADQLHVDAEGGTVYVHGLVSTLLEYQEVDRIGRSVPGVIRFINATVVDNARY